MGHRHEKADSNVSKERIRWEFQRAFYSFRRSIALAVIPLQLAALIFVTSKGAGSIYLNMLPILLLITVCSSFFVALIRGNQKILLLSLILLTIGTMLQSIFKQEAILKNPEYFQTHSPVAGLQLQYILGLAAAVMVGFIYWNIRECSSIKTAEILFLISMALSLVTLVFAKSVGNVKNWISIGGISLQTTEIVKFLYVFIAAALLGTWEKPDRKRIAGFFLVSFAIMGCLVLQSEFGTLLLILMVFFTVLFMFLPDIRIFLLSFFSFVCLGGLATAVGLWLSKLSAAGSSIAQNAIARKYLSNFMKIANRFIYWKNPELDSLGKGYQLIMARKSILLGGWFGTSSVTDLPVKTSDLVFPALIQRCGMIFALLVFLVFICLWLEGMRLAVKKQDKYHRMMAIGLVSLFIDQTIIIIAGSTGLCPLTGITLPFISSGGSSLIVSFMLISVLICISGNVSWKGINSEKVEFFKKGTDCARSVLAFGHRNVRILVQNIRSGAGNLPGGGPGKGGGQAGTV